MVGFFDDFVAVVGITPGDLGQLFPKTGHPWSPSKPSKPGFEGIEGDAGCCFWPRSLSR